MVKIIYYLHHVIRLNAIFIFLNSLMHAWYWSRYGIFAICVAGLLVLHLKKKENRIKTKTKSKQCSFLWKKWISAIGINLYRKWKKNKANNDFFHTMYTKNVFFKICKNKHMIVDCSQKISFLQKHELVTLVLSLKKKYNKINIKFK